MIGDMEILACRAIERLKAGGQPTKAEMEALAEVTRIRWNRQCMPQVWELLAAGWTIDLDCLDHDLDVWQRAFRAPPRRPGKPGRRFASTGQAYGAMRRAMAAPGAKAG